MISIFKQYPSLKEKIPYITLGEFPTPLMHLAKLGKEIGADRLYLKNDGLSGSIYGGIKYASWNFFWAMP